MKTENKTVVVAVRMTKKEKDKLDSSAVKQGRTSSNLANYLITEGLKNGRI